MIGRVSLKEKPVVTLFLLRATRFTVSETIILIDFAVTSSVLKIPITVLHQRIYILRQ